jgi:two-component system response regulator YesN
MYRLLIVDDEEDIRRGLAEFFPWNEIGFEVADTVENGKRALECVRKGGIDVVFCDIRMPVMSGIELAKAIFEENPRMPVVFLSAFKDFSYAQKAIQYGVRDYVLKPTSYEGIRSVFRKLKKELDYGLPAAHPEGKESTEESPVGRTDAVLAAIKGYAEREYARATLKGAARVAHMNPQYVSRLFKERTGENFHTFLTRIKMEKAAQLLHDVDYLTYEVSEIVGYSNPKNFTRTFKKHFGVSPREYRHSS